MNSASQMDTLTAFLRNCLWYVGVKVGAPGESHPSLHPRAVGLGRLKAEATQAAPCQRDMKTILDPYIVSRTLGTVSWVCLQGERLGTFAALDRPSAI